MEDLTPLLKERPDLVQISENLQAMLAEEAKLREEFYNTISEDDKAEFINGQVVMHSPVKLEHLQCNRLLMNLLHNYTTKFDLGEVYPEKMMVHLTRNSYEPDIVFFTKEQAKKFKIGQMLFPAPDFVVEILSPSTEKHDRGVKFEDYALHNITEYWIINPTAKSIEQYVLDNNTYILEFTGKKGVISSKTINGFSFDIKSIFSKAENVKAMQLLMQQ